MRIGIISDTHDLLRPEVLAALSGADAIFHLYVTHPGVSVEGFMKKMGL